MNTAMLIDEATALPKEEKALIIESLLESLNQTEKNIDDEWHSLARKRLDELRLGTVTTINGDQVFQNIWHKLNQ